jgi:hypothetical protein
MRASSASGEPFQPWEVQYCIEPALNHEGLELSIKQLACKETYGRCA